jgi:hypothetical protein
MRQLGCGADLCPVTAQVCVMSMPGISEVCRPKIRFGPVTCGVLGDQVAWVYSLIRPVLLQNSSHAA